jgi:signal recognition particle subunit SEC65
MARQDREVAIPKALEGMGVEARVWAVAHAIPNASKEEIVAAAKKLGVPPKSAVRQWRDWRHARRLASTVRGLPASTRQQIQRLAAEAR